MSILKDIYNVFAVVEDIVTDDKDNKAAILVYSDKATNKAEATVAGTTLNIVAALATMLIEKPQLLEPYVLAFLQAETHRHRELKEGNKSGFEDVDSDPKAALLGATMAAKYLAYFSELEKTSRVTAVFLSDKVNENIYHHSRGTKNNLINTYANAMRQDYGTYVNMSEAVKIVQSERMHLNN